MHLGGTGDIYAGMKKKQYVQGIAEYSHNFCVS